MTRARYTLRPVSDRTAFTGERHGDPFRSGWTDTEWFLLDEIDRLDGRDIVLELDVTEADIRLDGTLRANARPTSPAVRIAFDSRVGPLTYATDRYATWLANARAIALGLQALRAVDRHGITRRGEQYTGFKAIGSGTGDESSHMTREQAIRLIEEMSGRDLGLPGGHSEAKALRVAKAAAHPDRHDGNRVLWDQVEQAAAVLGLLR